MYLKVKSIALCVTAGIILLGCSGHQANLTDGISKVSGEEQSDLSPQLWPKRNISPPKDQGIERRAAIILAKMSLHEKVGQIVQPELKYVTPDDVIEYHLGSILNGGGTTPNNDKYASVADWVNQADQFYRASMDTSDGNVGIPLIWGSDAIHGNNNLLGATLFPHNIGLGAANDIELISKIGSVTALEVAATGVNWTFGPTVAVVRDVRWGRTYESYSEDPKIVANYARAMVEGIQGVAGSRTPGVYTPGKLVATAKHFVGDGGTTRGIDRGDTAVSEQELLSIHAAGYIAALDSNVLTTMASFNSWNGKKLHGHGYLLNEILKKRMGFDGLVVSDWNGHRHLLGCTVDQCAPAINAGIDMVMVPQDWKAFYHNTVQDVKNGSISMARLDDAVTRILRVKLHAGLFDAGDVLQREHVGDSSLVGHPSHRALAREAVRKSLVLLKNNNGLLPLPPKSNVLIAGDAADNIGKQSGGWTISWQGTGNVNDDFPGATSVYAGLHQAITDGQGFVHLSEKGEWNSESFPSGAKPDVAIVVFGEEPYAEWHGDIANIEYQYGTKTDLALLRSLQEQGIPVVSVFISGRPLWVNKELNASDAFVAAWLPGTEGAGIADVLVEQIGGKVNHDFQGRLSFSWPNLVSQAKLNVGAADYRPLFPYGYGLNYAATNEPIGKLSESSIRDANDALEDAWIFVSREFPPWSIVLQDQAGVAVAVNGNNAVSGVGANLSILSVDKVSQEDARQVVWKGDEPAKVSFASQFPQDLGDYVTEQANLSFAIKVDSTIKASIDLSVSCVDDCSNKVSLNKRLASIPLGDWTKISIPLSCLIKQGSSLNKVTHLFTLESTGALDLSFADIKLIPADEKPLLNQSNLSCD